MADSMKRGLYDDLLDITCGSHAMISDFLARLAAGSPEVIEAMALGIYESRWTRHGEKPKWPWRSPNSTCDWDALIVDARAALAAGMNVVANG